MIKNRLKFLIDEFVLKAPAEFYTKTQTPKCFYFNVINIVTMTTSSRNTY